jgi:ABC-2 type transport system ATP-binding protein
MSADMAADTSPSPDGAMGTLSGTRPMQTVSTDASGADAPVIRATGLAKKYGSTEAVKDASFEVRSGDVFGFLGPNGSGKSTTIAMLLGLIRPTRGQIDFFGMGPARREEALTRVGAIIEIRAFYPYLSGRDNLRVMAHLRPGVTKKRIEEMLDIVGLSGAAKKPFGNYSLGMKQRLGIASTLLHNPDLLILNEPTNGLDPAGMVEVRHLLLRLAAEGKTIFISSHLLNEIEQVCDRVAIINKGTIIAEGAVDDLVQQSQATLVRVDQPRQAITILRELGGVQQVEECGDDLLVTAPGLPPAKINAVLVQAGLDVHELRRAENSLERVFLEITGTASEQAA